MQIKEFEQRMANIYKTGVIKAPIHLRSGEGYEDSLTEIFKEENIGGDDWVLGYWDSHALCLLKGVPEKDLESAIRAGKSIALCFPEYKILCSGIVGSLFGVAVGIALGLRRRGENGRVFIYCGDMSAETGIFMEAVKYAYNHELPIKFIVGDNGVSVMTDTKTAWNSTEPWFINTKYASIIHYFKYRNDWPHSGLKERIAF